MKLVSSKQTAQQKDINSQLREIRKQKYIHNMDQKKIFEHLVKNNLQLDLKKPEHLKILADSIPQIYREMIWPQLLKNHHGVTPKLYQKLLKKVVKVSNQIIQNNKNQQMKELQMNKAKSEGYVPSQKINVSLQKISKWFDTIKQDIPRTFSQLKIFQSLCPQNSKDANQTSRSNKKAESQERQSFLINNESHALFNILSSWVVYREDIGYRQGMSQVAGYLFIELSNQIKAFQIFCSIMTTDSLYQFFTMNLQYVSLFCSKVHSRLRQRHEEMYEFFDNNAVDYKLFVLDWMFSLFTKCFELDTVGKIWDLLLLYGLDEKILLNTVVEIICAFEEEIFRFLTNYDDVDVMQVCRFLKKAKVDEIRQSKILTKLKEVNF